MQDNQLIELFLPLINNGLSAAGYSTAIVVSAYQPTQQGVTTPPTVYFFKVGDHRYGFPKREDVWDSVHSQMVHTETQQYETTFQISALVIQNPASISFTASDLVNTVAQIMQSDNTWQTLIASDVGIYRITDVRNPYFTDDKGRFEASPSFTFTLTHKQISTTVDHIINDTVPGIYRV